MKKKALHVLLVEDNSGDARLLREMFRTESPDSFELTHVLRLGEALVLLAKGGIDIVLLDMGLPDGHGLDTVRRAHAVAPGIPLIVLTGMDDEALAAEAMKEGAQDYLIKGQIENRALPRALRHSIERQRMQMETDLIRTHQMQFKDEFLSHVSHELRSPLTAIHQFVTILLDGLAGDLKSDQRQYLDIVLRNIKQLDSMINDLLEVTRVQAGKLVIELQCTSVSDAIDFVVNTLQGAAKAKEITLFPDIEHGLPLVCADPTRIRQILIVLLDNAIKFTPAKGAVKVKARVFDDDANFLVLEVSDTGSGISPDMTERIFERLFQAPDLAWAGRKGLGLGLYICKELVTHQGGQIWAESTPGEGSVFSFTLPVFSVPKLIAPALRHQGPAETLVTLVVTELASQTGWLSDEVRAEHCHGVRELLQRCLHSDLDVLLPKMGSAGAAELFFIVAVTDAIGAEAILKRIREQFRGRERTLQAGLTLSTFFRSLEAFKRSDDESVDMFLERASTEIQEIMNEEISSRMVHSGT
jgi:sigma-B regulation protein RsbU (phosphoserine phosphatase)